MRYDNVTFMMTLPRSRSAWLCQFLRPAGVAALHDPLGQCASIDELGEKIDTEMELLKNWCQPETAVFVADTSAVMFFSEIDKRFPFARYLFVYRNYDDVRRSLKRAGLNGLSRNRLGWMIEQQAAANRLCEREDKFHYRVDFPYINENLRNIWRFVGVRSMFDPAYADRMASVNIQVSPEDQAARMRPDKMVELYASIGLDYVG